MQVLVPDEIEEMALSSQESSRLVELESVIKENFTGFVAVGNALAEIRDKRLYRQGGKTFEIYCQEIWDIHKNTANQYIAASKVIDNLTAIAVKNIDGELTELPIPTNEAQARELTKLTPEEQVAVWQRLLGSGTKITAKAVKKAVLSFRGKALVEGIEKSKKEVRENSTDFQSEAFTEAFDRFFDQLNVERNANWRFTSRKTVYRILQGLIDLVAEAVPGTLGEYGCAMELSDREKLKKAGFRIFRMDAKNKLIEEWYANNWSVLMECKSSKQLHDAFEELLKNPHHLKG